MASTILEPSRTVKKPTLEMSWDSDALFEVSQGKRVELPKLSPYSSQIAI